MKTVIRPSTDLRNYYNKIAKECQESRTHCILTKNGRENIGIMGIQDYNQITAELMLLRNLVDAEEDVISGRVSPIKETFNSIRERLFSQSTKA